MNAAAPALADLAGAHAEIRERMHLWLAAVAAGDAPEARARYGAFSALLRAHAAMEEEHLLPPFAARGLETAGCTAQILRTEHDKLRRLLGAAGAALEAAGAPITPRARVELILSCHLLRELLEHHDARERAGFFPALDGALSPAERTALYETCSRSQESAASRLASEPSSCSS